MTAHSDSLDMDCGVEDFLTSVPLCCRLAWNYAPVAPRKNRFHPQNRASIGAR
jgi:hypothetical protein